MAWNDEDLSPPQNKNLEGVGSPNYVGRDLRALYQFLNVVQNPVTNLDPKIRPNIDVGKISSDEEYETDTIQFTVPPVNSGDPACFQTRPFFLTPKMDAEQIYLKVSAQSCSSSAATQIFWFILNDKKQQHATSPGGFGGVLLQQTIITSFYHMLENNVLPIYLSPNEQLGMSFRTSDAGKVLNFAYQRIVRRKKLGPLYYLT